MKLSKKQTQAIDVLEDNKTKQFVFGGGAGGGKSFVGCYWIIKNCLRYPGSRWLIGRAKLKTLKDTTLKSFFAVCRIQGLNAGIHYNYNAQSNVITFINGSEVLLKDLALYPSDPNFDELGSLEITGAFIDECNQIVKKAWNIVMSRIRHRVSEFGLVPKIFGSCNPSKNWVYQDFYNPEKIGQIKSTHRFIQSLATDNPAVDPHYIENLKELDETSRERLLYGNWEYDDDPANLFDYSQLSDVFTNTFVKKTGEKYMTADVALQGSDKFVIIIWDGWVIEKIYSIDKCDGKEAIEILEKYAKKHNVPQSNIVYDNDGIGAFIKGFLKNANSFVNNSSPLEIKKNGKTIKPNYGNLKSQCSFGLKSIVEENKMYCEHSSFRDEIIAEMSQVKQKDIDKDGKISVEGKDKVKERLGHSPDYWDAIMFRYFFELKKKRTYFSPMFV